jgi:16S rRNA (uracil1498-N3)-methyltransferase
MHRFFYQHDGITPAPGDSIQILGEEAKHAIRVKRLSEGTQVELIDGSGLLAQATLTGSEKLGKRDGWAVNVQINAVSRAEPVRPQILVRSAVPRGPKLEGMIEGLSQIGASGWGPLITERAVVDPRESKIIRMERVVEESAKQCGRPWLMEIMPRVTLADLLEADIPIVVADASGARYEAAGDDMIMLAVGPEGGWTEKELTKLKDAGARVCSFGTNILRIETAAVTACSIILDHEQRAAHKVCTRNQETSQCNES